VVIAGLLRVVSTAHAFLSAPRPLRFRVLQAGIVVALLAATVGTHAFVAADAWIARQADLDIAANNQFFAAQVLATPTAGPTSTPMPVPTPVPTPTPADTSEFHPAGVGPGMEATAAPTPNPSRITFLAVGTDFMTGRAHLLTDTLMVVSIDTTTGKVALVSVPRDTANFDLYYGGYVSTAFKINDLYSAVARGSLKSPDPPMTTLEKEIGFLVGIPIDYYAAVDLEGFRDMVDAVGGVDIDNPRAVDDPFTGTEVPAGPVHLDGHNALKYVRSREGAGDSDYTRAGRQQLVLVALERKVASPAVLPKLGALISQAGKSIATDFPLKNARDYVSVAQNVTSISQCVLGPPYSYHPPTSTTGGAWTSRLDLALVANLSVEFFGSDSRYYGLPGVVPAACGK
jgi:LCP family protein required for cell wall assembly